MFLILIGLLLLIMVLGIINRRNRYMFVMIMNLTGVLFLLFFGTIYTLKVQNYTYMTQYDYFLYLSIANIKLPLTSIRGFYNLSFGIYMFSDIYAFKQVLRLKWKQVILMCLSCIIYVIINSARWTIAVEVNKDSNIIMNLLWNYQNIVSTGILAINTMLPFAASVIAYKRAEFMIEKRDIFAFGSCLSIITIYIYAIFIFGSFRKIIFWNVNAIGLPKTAMAESNYLSVTVITFILLIITVMILIIFKPFNRFSCVYNNEKYMRQESQIFNEKLNFNLHRYKNMICSAKQQFEIIKRAMEAGDYDSIIKYAEDGINMSDSNYEQIRHTMEAFADSVMKIEKVDIVECMENCFLRLPMPTEIEVNKQYQYPKIYTYGNKTDLSEAFYNILMNSVESFENKEGHPHIDVKIRTNESICMIEISDNGCGIAKKNLKKIFNPFYSTKSSTYNSGIGLNFVKKIVKSYHGTIYVLSKPNESTSLQLTITYAGN